MIIEIYENCKKLLRILVLTINDRHISINIYNLAEILIDFETND